MGWSIGFDSTWNRDVGYGVPAYCDHPECNAEIDRGLAYVCGGEPFGGDEGCGLFFCAEHMAGFDRSQRCECCAKGRQPFKPKPDHPKWMRWKLKDSSWRDWRKLNPEVVKGMRAALATLQEGGAA